VERGVSYHGIALNVTTHLEDFALIDPCGDPDTVSTSVAAEAGRPREPASTRSVAQAAAAFAPALARRLGARLVGRLPAADPAA
jgi:lipoate-protein ligase B